MNAKTAKLLRKLARSKAEWKLIKIGFLKSSPEVQKKILSEIKSNLKQNGSEPIKK